LKLEEIYTSTIGNTAIETTGKIATSDNLLAVICNGGVTICKVTDDTVVRGNSIKLENVISVALTDDILVVGTNTEEGTAGVVYIYAIEDYELRQLVALEPSDPDGFIGYGAAVAINDNNIIVSSPRMISSHAPLLFGCIHLYRLDGRKVINRGIVSNHHDSAGSTYGGYLSFNEDELVVSVIDGSFKDGGLVNYGYQITEESLIPVSTTKLDANSLSDNPDLIDLCYKFGNLALLTNVVGDPELTLYVGPPGGNMYGFISNPEYEGSHADSIALHKTGIFVHAIRDGKLTLIFLKQHESKD